MPTEQEQIGRTGAAGAGRQGRGHLLVLAFAVIAIMIAGLVAVLGLSAWVKHTTREAIAGAVTSHDDRLTEENITELKAARPDCIMVLGASVHADGTPSPMLADRLDLGIALYQAGVAPKLLLTGDNGQVEYNEVAAMLEYVTAAGVPAEDVFLDHAGFSTYDSVYRAQAVFGVNRMVAVTQKYHLYRTLYGCRAKGLQAVGAAADQERYTGQWMRDLREVLARDKDVVKWRLQPDPTYLGDAIPIAGDGRQTQ